MAFVLICSIFQLWDCILICVHANFWISCNMLVSPWNWMSRKCATTGILIPYMIMMHRYINVLDMLGLHSQFIASDFLTIAMQWCERKKFKSLSDGRCNLLHTSIPSNYLAMFLPNIYTDPISLSHSNHFQEENWTCAPNITQWWWSFRQWWWSDDDEDGMMMKIITLDRLCKLVLGYCYTALLGHFGTGSEAPDLHGQQQQQQQQQ